jgi:predicted nucleotidyltransferase
VSKVRSERKELTREGIISALVEALKPLDFVQAVYEGGAAAFKRIDEWSDIDIYLIVDDDKVAEAFQAAEKALKILSPITVKLDMLKCTWPDISQAFYRLEKAPEFLLVDLAVIKSSSKEKFLQPEIHGDVLFYFNKSSTIKVTSLDKKAFTKKLCKRIDQLRAKFDMFNIFVRKELKRGNVLEALELYHSITLATLIEILRIVHNPYHHDFKTRYIHYELPSETIENLKQLFFVKSDSELYEKYNRASAWIRELFDDEIQKLIL